MSYNYSSMDTTFQRIGAIILAGGNVPATLSQYCTYRVLLRMNGRYLLEYLLDALQALPSVVSIAIVAPAETLDDLAHLPGIKVAASDTLVDNMRRGAEALDDARITHNLFITGDVPLVTSEGIEDFVRKSIESGAALTYPVIPQAVSEERFPGTKRTYVRLREGTFTGGNAILTRAHLLDDKHAIIQELYAARKNPIKLAKIFGWPVLVRLMCGFLTFPYMEAVAGRILDARARVIVTHFAEIGFDVDKADDLAAVERAWTESFPPSTATNGV
jgi:molybdopterin-guanine dinucleotide biosynthesis protein A